MTFASLIKILLASSALVLVCAQAPEAAAKARQNADRAEPKHEVKTKIINFPGDSSFGDLQYRISPESEQEKLVPAKGQVKIPTQAKIMLEPSTFLLRNANLIKACSDTISGITISGEPGKSIMAPLSGNKSIETVRVKNASLDASLITFTNSLPRLKNLLLDSIGNGKAADQFKFIKQLESARVSSDSVAPVLTLIAGSKQVKKIEIHNTKLTKKDFQLLQQLPALQFLSIQNTQYPDSAVTNLPQFKALRILWLGSRPWSTKTVAPLKQLKNLKELHVQFNEEDISLLREVHDALPEVWVD